MLRSGDNAVGAFLGNGSYCGVLMCWPQRPRVYGECPWLLAQLEIETADGDRRVIASDDTWRVNTEGPLRQSGIYEGETCTHRTGPGRVRVRLGPEHRGVGAPDRPGACRHGRVGGPRP